MDARTIAFANGKKEQKELTIAYVIGLQTEQFPRGSEGYRALQELLKLLVTD